MRKFSFFLILLLFFLLLGSLFFPTGFDVRQSVIIFNNEKVVTQQFQDLQILKEWIKKAEGKIVREDSAVIYWTDKDAKWRVRLLPKREKKRIFLRLQNIDTRENYIIRVTIRKEVENCTELSVKLLSERHTLHPVRRYLYLLNKKSVTLNLQSALQFVKQKCEAIHFERFRLTNPQIVSKNELVFSLPRSVKQFDLQKNKQRRGDSLLLKRLLQYKLLDTTKNMFVRYTEWNDSVVNYSTCIPLLKPPTSVQKSWLQAGEIQTIQGRYYATTYTGKPQDLPLAWDSLYTIMKDKGINPHGLPIEELIEKTDSSELRKLFVQIR